jgi:hypothetical protein
MTSLLRKKNLALLTVLTSLSLSTSGCLVGIVFWPLWIVGSLTGATGLGMAFGGLAINNAYVADSGFGLIGLGSILDAPAPERADALNELPMTQTVADQAGVELSAIRSYNRNLEHIRNIGLELARDIRSQATRTDLMSIQNAAQLEQDAQIDALAVKYGFQSAHHFFSTFRQKALKRDELEAFARQTQLSLDEAKLLLRFGFAVASESVD